ncbi:MAG: ATP-binding cassette domain-containing protein [Actinobacteria bacterium]|nr:ATP-binding cassette domain-containing protein [Actinomycetota bacterium]
MIRIEGLEVRVGEFRLRIDDLVLQTGEYLTILGPTGSGKTVLLETIAGLHRPTAGSISFGEKNVTRYAPEQRRIGFVYQDYVLFPHLDVERNIAFGVEPSLAGAKARELAVLLGIEHLLHRYPDGLSGGEQQRVAIARALAIEPPLLLLDEPLSALDRETRRELRNELRRLHEGLRTTVLHVTHDLDEALALGHRLAILVAGELRQIDNPSQVLRHPNDATVARLTGATNVFPATLVGGVVGGDATDHATDRLIQLRVDGGPELHSAGPLQTRNLQTPAGIRSVAAIIRPEEIDIALSSASTQKPSGFSPSDNTLTGIIRQISQHNTYASIEVEVPPVFCVHILSPEVERRGLVADRQVTLRFPTTAVSISPR